MRREIALTRVLLEEDNRQKLGGEVREPALRNFLRQGLEVRRGVFLSFLRVHSREYRFQR